VALDGARRAAPDHVGGTNAITRQVPTGDKQRDREVAIEIARLRPACAVKRSSARCRFLAGGAEVGFQDPCAVREGIRRGVDRSGVVMELCPKGAGIVHRFVMAW
jgi:hypothetical protein